MLEPPALGRVDRIVRAAVHAYKERFYQHTWAKLSPLTRTRLGELLRPADDGVDDELELPVKVVTRFDFHEPATDRIDRRYK